MKLPKLHLAAETNNLRPAMQCIKIEGNKAIVTEGHMIIVYKKLHDFFDKEVLKFLDGQLIHKDIWKMICECELFSVTSGQFSCHYKGQWLAFPYLSQGNHKFPQWEAVFPQKNILVDNVFAINPYLIGKLSTIFRSTYLPLKMTVGENHKAICFEDNDTQGNEFIGLIMPISINHYA